MFKPKIKKIILWLVISLIVILIGVVSYVKIYNYYNPYSFEGVCDDIYCNPAIEEQGKIDVAKRPEVIALAEKYGWDKVYISALDIKLATDIEFIKQIRPDFEDKTGCIIIVMAGDEGFIYQEDEDLNVIYSETIQEFIEKTKDVDPEIMARFYLSTR